MTETSRQPSSPIASVAGLLLLTLACLVPFANKAYHIDDTLFLRAAEQIQKHPGNFYGLTMNWFGTPMPMTEVFDNPPLTCYYIALVGVLAGWSELAMHLAFLLPALAAAWGTFALARNYCHRPLLAAVIAVLTPVFLISATTIMCDVLLLAFWVWTLVFFEKGLQQQNHAAFFAAGLLAGLAVWTKFTGLALVPLLAAYALCRQRRLGGWLLAVMVPLLFAGAYEWLTRGLYGQGLLLTATSVATHDRAALGSGQLLERNLLGLVFAGGCFLPILFYAPLLWSRRGLLFGLCLIAGCLCLLPGCARLKPLLWQKDGGLNWWLWLQVALYAATGIQILFLVVTDLWDRRDAASVLLLLWVLGIFVFATALNWTVNGRSFLPMLPALGILAARRRDFAQPADAPGQRWRMLAPLLVAATLSLFLAQTDYRTAGAYRAAAGWLHAHYQTPQHTLRFEGHWGFQYYMEACGATAMDLKVPKLPAGDFLVVPSRGSNVRLPSPDTVNLIDTLDVLHGAHCTLMNSELGAGFYASPTGPLPFVFGPVEPIHFWVFQVKP